MTFKAIAILAQNAIIKKLYLVTWNGESEKALLRSYGAMRYELKKQGTEIVRIGNYKHAIQCGNETITLMPSTKALTYRTITYPQIEIKEIKLV